MGLSASMWTSVSGLLSHGNKMNVVGNNIANVSTIGFKSQRMDFNDYLYINGGSTSGPTQIGAGVSTYAVIGDFSQGSLESTNSVTDIAIDGNGFFKVRQPNTEQMYYTRAGDFYFNADRQLQNPEGYRLQGWKVDSGKNRLTFQGDGITLGANTANESAFQGTGTPRDIVLDSWYLEPLRTDSVSFTMGLTGDKDNDLARSEFSPLLGLAGAWNGTATPPLADKNYATSSSIKVYDESGIAHDLTVYYDQMTQTDAVAGLPSGYSMYEYIVTIPPSEDMRTYGDTEKNGEWEAGTPFQGTSAAGLLMTGHMIFDAAGNLVTQSAYTYQGKVDDEDGKMLPPSVKDPATGVETLNYGAWASAEFSSNGLPVFTANFKGIPGRSTTTDKKASEDQLIEIDFGIRSANKWGGQAPGSQTLAELKLPDPEKTKDGTIVPSKTYYVETEKGDSSATSREDSYYKEMKGSDLVGSDGKLKNEYEGKVFDIPTINYSNLALLNGGNGKDIIRNAQVTQAGSSSFVTQDATQNGYASGILSGTNITNDGIVYGYYDNGKTIPLYQIALYDFHNHQGLRREGGNLYAATEASGEPRQGVAGDNGFGVTRAYNIEQSNVDLSREFVNMITTQRGFQANSKGITTVDTMLETVIGMKR